MPERIVVDKNHQIVYNKQEYIVVSWLTWTWVKIKRIFTAMAMEMKTRIKQL